MREWDVLSWRAVAVAVAALSFLLLFSVAHAGPALDPLLLPRSPLLEATLEHHRRLLEEVRNTGRLLQSTGVQEPSRAAAESAFLDAISALSQPSPGIPLPDPWPPLGLPANVTEIVQAAGYPCIDYTVTTPDGFILSIQNIPYGAAGPSGSKRPVVFLQHGMGGSGVDWTLNGPGESLSFILADAGYDVWIGNNRGTLNSLNNDPNRSQYFTEDANVTADWNWSWDQEGMYDLPTQVSFVLQQTGAPSVAYVGHSQGTSQAFASFIKNSTFAMESINSFVALAPVAYLANCGSEPLKLLAELRLDEILLDVGYLEFWLPLPNVTQVLLPILCYDEPDLCLDVIALWCGPTQHLNASRAGYYLMYEPSPVSTQDASHYAQEIRDGTFAMYSYGREENRQHYGSTQPPAYNLTQMPADLPVALFYGGNDYLADPTDVQTIISLLPTTPYTHYEPTYAHLDPVLAPNAAEAIYPLVMNFIAEHVPSDRALKPLP